MKRKIIAIVGPTASGKTAIGVKLAKKFNGEIVSADSRQVFRGLDLGTGKDLAEYGNIKYHMIDVCEQGKDFNLFKYLELAKTAIEDIFSRGKLPIIVGGTGLYIQALIEGFELKSEIQNPKSETNSKLKIKNSKPYNREQLDNSTVGRLQDILQKIDSEAFERLPDKKNPHRLIRAIERAQDGFEMQKIKPDWDVLQIAIDLPRETLNKRIDKRADDRFEAGMINEVVNLIKSGVDSEWLLKLGLEYRIIGNFVISNFKFLISNKNSKIQMTNGDFEFMSQTLKLRSHQYAKRQVTWFKRFSEIIWLPKYDEIEKKAQEFLGKK